MKRNQSGPLMLVTGLAILALASRPAAAQDGAPVHLAVGVVGAGGLPGSFAAGRVSAVTVDALACGAPIVTTAGTWMGQQGERFKAGVALEDPSAAALHEAVRTVLASYAQYSANAREAARAIEREHDPAGLLSAVISAPPRSR